MDARRTSDKVRELGRLEPNRACFECRSKNPTYVNLFNATFVCENCAGLLRTYSHRLKSVSQAIFSADDVAQIASQGNQVAQAVWLARWDSARDQLPPSTDKVKMAEHLRLKYVEKRWAGESVQPRLPAPPSVKAVSALQPPPASSSPLSVRPPPQPTPTPPAPTISTPAAPKAVAAEMDFFAPLPPTAAAAPQWVGFEAASNPVAAKATTPALPQATPFASQQSWASAPAPAPQQQQSWTSAPAPAPQQQQSWTSAPAPAPQQWAPPAQQQWAPPAQQQWTQPQQQQQWTQPQQQQQWTQPQPQQQLQQPQWTPQPAVGQQWAPQPVVGQQWTPQPVVGQQWTPQPAVGQQWTPQPAAGQQWTPQPAAGQQLTPQPAVAQQWAAQSAAGQPQPAAPLQWAQAQAAAPAAPWTPVAPALSAQTWTPSAGPAVPTPVAAPAPTAWQPQQAPTAATSAGVGGNWSAATVPPAQPAAATSWSSAGQQPTAQPASTGGWSSAAQQPTAQPAATGGWSSAAQQPTAVAGWSSGLAPAAAAATQNGGSGSGPQPYDDAPVEPPRAPETPYVPPTELSKVMQLILERTEKLNGLRSAVRDQEQAFPDEATIGEWSPADRTKMLRRLEHLVGDHAEALMRVLLQLDAVNTETDDDRRFRKARVNEIQAAIHAADDLLKRIRTTCTRWGVTPRVAAH